MPLAHFYVSEKAAWIEQEGIFKRNTEHRGLGHYYLLFILFDFAIKGDSN